jgi:hypothetical protein
MTYFVELNHGYFSNIIIFIAILKIGSILAFHILTVDKIWKNMMKNENQIRTIDTKDKGWFWFSLTLAIQMLFIVISYLVINI